MRLFRRIIVLACLLVVARAPISSAATNYWQQGVRYDIRVALNDTIHTLNGTLRVTYFNHSPDTLREVYFHLYMNAFQPHSMMDERAHAIGSRPISERISKLPPSEWGVYTIPGVTDGAVPLDYEITGTILRVGLAKPLAPGDSTNIMFPFKEQIARQIRRNGWMSREGVQYSMSQWYPKIAEYDNEGWHRQEYIAREFYGVWGDFDVQITAPSTFTIGATGRVVNPNEVGHGYDKIAAGVREGSVNPDPARTGMTTWHFTASNVHDFAWVADESYIHQWRTWRDTVTIHALYKQEVAGLWQDALEYSERCLRIYSETFGPYGYRDFYNTMAGDGGMEYPQLIMITGYRPEMSLAGVTAHEIGHQWFYGMLGSNETREAFMDEGFTSFATTLAMNNMFGDNQRNPSVQRSWLDWFVPEFSNRSDNFRGYQSLAVSAFEEPLSIPHDWFREDINAGQVYGKTQAILSALQYTLGDAVFSTGMKQYFMKWRFKHPHLTDFQNVMEAVSHSDLDWFFDEWFKTTRTIDYGIESVTSHPGVNGYETTFDLVNHDVGVMPVDLLMHYEDGTSMTATIPLITNQDAAYYKSGSERFLPGWDWVSPRYHGVLNTPKRVSWVEIDTSLRMQDLHRSDNTATATGLWMPKTEWVVWKQLFSNPPMDAAYSVIRPILWYDAPSHLNVGLGTKFGMNNEYSGDLKLIYKAAPDRVENGISVEPLWYAHVDGALSYSTPTEWLGRLTSMKVAASKLDGIATLSGTFVHVLRPTYLQLGPTHTASITVEHQNRLNEVYPYYHTGWDAMTTSAIMRYSFASSSGQERIEAVGETSLWASDATYALAKVKFEGEYTLPLEMPAHIRFVGGSATSGTPFQKRFWLDRANNYEEQASSFFRSIAQLGPKVGPEGNLFVEGGGNLRGYSAVAGAADSMDASLAGVGVLALNFDLDLPNPFTLISSKLTWANVGLFADAGWISTGGGAVLNDIKRNLKTDAGLRFGFNLLSLLPYQLQGVVQEYAPIPTIKVYFPFYVNHPIDGKDPLAYRWSVSLGTAF